jgi:hypothetical protein
MVSTSQNYLEDKLTLKLILSAYCGLADMRVLYTVVRPSVIRFKDPSPVSTIRLIKSLSIWNDPSIRIQFSLIGV